LDDRCQISAKEVLALGVDIEVIEGHSITLMQAGMAGQTVRDKQVAKTAGARRR
jgi:hypothetical protein